MSSSISSSVWALLLLSLMVTTRMSIQAGEDEQSDAYDWTDSAAESSTEATKTITSPTTTIDDYDHETDTTTTGSISVTATEATIPSTGSSDDDDADDSGLESKFGVMVDPQFGFGYGVSVLQYWQPVSGISYPVLPPAGRWNGNQGTDDVGSDFVRCGRRASAEQTGFVSNSRNVTRNRPSDITEFPWQASIQRNGIHRCSGAILGPNYILATAHCFIKKTNVRAYKVFVGKTVGSEQMTGPFFIESIVINKNFQKKTIYDADVALIRLKTPIAFSQRVFPACQPSQGSSSVPNSDGRKCFISAYDWRKDVDNDRLYSVETKVLSSERCRQMTAGWTKSITDNVLCAGSVRFYNGSRCVEDAGAPLVCETAPGSNLYALHGLLSFSKKPCVRAGKPTPSMYTRVSQFLNWITVNAKSMENRRKQQ